MKLKKIIFLSLFLCMGVVTSHVSAQEILQNLLETLDKRTDVKIMNVNDKVITVTFRDNPELDKMILEAYAKSKESASNRIEEKDKGEVSKLFYTFTKDGKSISFSYELYSSGRREFSAFYP